MSAPERRRHPALARGAASVPGVARPRANATAGRVRTSRPDAHRIALIERELAELDAECARVRQLLQRLALARRDGRGTGAILGELGAAVLHLHVHTRGLDALIDEVG